MSRDIKGLVRLDDERYPLGVQVKLYDKNNGQLISQTISDNDGVFTFFHVESGDYMVVAYPPGSNNNAQIKSFEITV